MQINNEIIMKKVEKGGHFGKTRWQPLEGIFGVALTLIFFALLSTSYVPSFMLLS